MGVQMSPLSEMVGLISSAGSQLPHPLLRVGGVRNIFFKGPWVAQLVKYGILGFTPDHDLLGCGIHLEV